MKKFDKNKQLRKLHNKKNNNSTKIITIVLSITILVGAIIYFTFARFESTASFSLINGTANIQSIPLIDKINSLKSNGSTELEYDETTDNNLRYIGSNPNNYVEFNGELWRIIGVMNNIEKEDGTTESLVKIRRAELLDRYSWDSSDSSINNGAGINQWGATDTYEGADLMRELNTDYLGNITVGTDGKWYNGLNNSKPSKMPTSTLSTSAQSMIETVKWNLGSPSNNNGTYDSSWQTNIIPSTSYTRERANTNGKTCTTGERCNDNVTRTSTWTGKVGLIYLSDYGYATSGGTTINRETCLNKEMYNWNSSEVSDCINNDWLFQPSYLYQWTLSPGTDSSHANFVFYVNGVGSVNHGSTYNTDAVFPVVFLKSGIYITGGNGSSTEPYKLIYQPKLSDHIISKASDDASLRYDGSKTLGQYGTEDNNLRYVGLNPNNYVYFNCSTTKQNEMNDSTCEKWRILGVYNNVEDENNNKITTVKIMRDESIGGYSIDSSASSVNGGSGINQWGESTYDNGTAYEGADLMRELNTDYLGNITVGTDGKWYSKMNNAKENNMPTVTLNQNTQEMIQKVYWNTGAIGTNGMLEEYKEERNSTSWRSSNTTTATDKVVRKAKWLGKVGLMNATDYGYSTVGGSTLNLATCLNNGVFNWYFDDYTDCYNNTWINNGKQYWSINPIKMGLMNGAYYFTNNATTPGVTTASTSFDIRPTVFLKENIKMIEGNGTSTEPYKLSLK